MFCEKCETSTVKQGPEKQSKMEAHIKELNVPYIIVRSLRGFLCISTLHWKYDFNLCCLLSPTFGYFSNNCLH